MRSACGTATSSSAISAVSDECMPSFSSWRETEHAGQRRVDDEQRDAAVAGVGIGLHDEREEVRACSVRDEHLAAVDAPDVAVADAPRPDRGDVGAGVGLGDRDRPDLLARDRRASQRSRWSSVPKWASAGVAMSVCTEIAIGIAPAPQRASSSTNTRPAARSPSLPPKRAG